MLQTIRKHISVIWKAGRTSPTYMKTTQQAKAFQKDGQIDKLTFETDTPKQLKFEPLYHSFKAINSFQCPSFYAFTKYEMVGHDSIER